MFSRVLILTIVNVLCVAAYDSYDYLMFAQHWPTSECILSNKAASGSCGFPKSVADTWSIHGLWPSRFSSSRGPAFCHPPDAQFDWSKISSLESELLAGWPNVVTDEEETSFWGYEWKKHGTCAEEVPAVRGEYNFFREALNLRMVFNIKQYLENAGITPSNTTTYQFGQIHGAIEKATGKAPKFECVEDGQNKKWYINSVRICLDKNLHAINCPGQKLSPLAEALSDGAGNNLPQNKPCPSSVPIIYPVVQFEGAEPDVPEPSVHFRSLLAPGQPPIVKSDKNAYQTNHA